MQLTPRKLNALVMMGVGLLLIFSSKPLTHIFATANDFLLAGIALLAPVGLIFLALGLYRYFSEGPESK
jgi:hypothetical protein